MTEQVLTDFEIVKILNTDRPKTGWAYGLCREVEAKVVSRCRGKGGNTSDNITQAAANKAAEEGELEQRDLMIESLLDLMSEWNEAPRGEDAAQVFNRVESLIDSYVEQAIAADRASRQVANKAEVETIDTPEFRELLAAFKNSSLGFDYNETVKNLVAHINGRFATPLATTGASTVLTDERIEWILRDLGVKAADAGMPMTSIAFARAIEREVAAQAGQVAVPGGLHKASVGLIHALDVLPRDKDILWARIEKPLRAFRSALVELERAIPSPAKESK